MQILINSKRYRTIHQLIEEVTPYSIHQYGRFKRETGLSVNSEESLRTFIDWMEKERSGKNCKSCAKKLFYNGVEHKSLKKLFDYLGTKPSIYVSYRKSTGKEIRTNKDIDDFVHYLSERKNNRYVGNTSFYVEGKKYSSIKDFVENATPYKITQYNRFKQETEISINSTETAKEFLKWMKNRNKPYPVRKSISKRKVKHESSERFSFYIEGKKYSSIKDFIENATPYNVSQYNRFKQETGISINSTETAKQFLEHMNNKYSKLPLRKNPIEYNNKKYYYVKHLLQAIGSNEYEYSEFKRKTGVIISDRNSFQKYLDYKKRI